MRSRRRRGGRYRSAQPRRACRDKAGLRPHQLFNPRLFAPPMNCSTCRACPTVAAANSPPPSLDFHKMHTIALQSMHGQGKVPHAHAYGRAGSIETRTYTYTSTELFQICDSPAARNVRVDFGTRDRASICVFRLTTARSSRSLSNNVPLVACAFTPEPPFPAAAPLRASA